ncbi:aldolase catalytic domain-containing protein [Eubacterium callanderi]|uniref:aldolase catalytic domain-containing protein n=1 Tax=Eubacterium callanderi TaxID=53442 RepID=UPI001C1179A9|nr:aldolase catalytic domain-containing protein [Eubacterium callanderi]MBU5305040.1 aldolase catalytic domain-containing protein [Eubacterium callanderi]
MNRIKVLDCTLRDGGYCNQWSFGLNNIKKIINRLEESGVEIIECGFLTNKIEYDNNFSKFSDINQISRVIHPKSSESLYVCMMNYGEYPVKQLPDRNDSTVDGIRIAFHKKDLENALLDAKVIKQKGYKVFIQAMVSLNYTDKEYLYLINKCNEIDPYAFYIVDSFGVMKSKDLIRLFYMVEHNLKEGIHIGYHSHNNMQLAYSNAQALASIQTKRYLIIDTSVYGMGRGAGNLNTELFVEHLNDNYNKQYDSKPLLVIIDEVLNNFYQKNYWGYSLPNYLSAKHNAHPNYATYLDDKKTLTVENMDEIFSLMDIDKKNSFNKPYIEELYVNYMENGRTQEEHLAELTKYLTGKTILIIAPGKSSEDEKDKIITFLSKKNVASISVNFIYPEYETDYIFLSNLRRFKELDKTKKDKCIVTSNIPGEGVYLQTNYRELLNSYESVQDNSSMMLVKFLIKLKVKEIIFAGLDGYAIDTSQNFASEKMSFSAKKSTLENMNTGMSEVLKLYSKKIKIGFLTKPRYVRI